VYTALHNYFEDDEREDELVNVLGILDHLRVVNTAMICRRGCTSAVCGLMTVDYNC